MADELNKLDGANEADVIVKVHKIVAVDKAFLFCCMFSLRMQDEFWINNRPEVIIGKRFAVKETFVFICRQMGGAAHLFCIENGHINQLKDEISSIESLMLMCQCSKGIACHIWVRRCLHLCYGFRCYPCWTVWFAEVTCWNANNANAWCEIVSVEDTWTFTARDWTQLVNPELRLEQIVEKGLWADEILCLLLLALAYWIEGKACWELALVAFGHLWMISSSTCIVLLKGHCKAMHPIQIFDLLFKHSD